MFRREFNCLPCIVLYILVNIYNSNCHENVNLANNFNPVSGKSTFWLTQERNNSLLFQWDPFDNLDNSVLHLESHNHKTERKLSRRTKFGVLQTIGKACQPEEYTITQYTNLLNVLTIGIGETTKETRKLNYTLVPRVSNVRFERKNGKPTYIEWELNDGHCSLLDKINIFKKDSTGFHRMYRLSIDSRRFSFPQALEDQEDIIIVISHKDKFGLFVLDQPLNVTMKMKINKEVTTESVLLNRQTLELM
ncbi:hypothetical protein KSF78_0009264 [Schistosoma japonicum]|nr:hypothetical protein KSF78_0009264 [Schistosoma japonicum]